MISLFFRRGQKGSNGWWRRQEIYVRHQEACEYERTNAPGEEMMRFIFKNKYIFTMKTTSLSCFVFGSDRFCIVLYKTFIFFNFVRTHQFWNNWTPLGSTRSFVKHGSFLVQHITHFQYRTISFYNTTYFKTGMITRRA